MSLTTEDPQHSAPLPGNEPLSYKERVALSEEPRQHSDPTTRRDPPTSTAALLEDLHRRGVRLGVDGLTLRVDAPEEAATDELRHTLRENKRALIRHLEHERHRLQAADRRGLVIKWAGEPGYLALHDPTTGEWHEVPASGCPQWMLDDAKAHRRRRREK